MKTPPDNQQFVDWFRQASPYIHAHRGRVFVLSFGGEALTGPTFPGLIHDIALLNGLGIRLVLVPGSRPQIERRLDERAGAMQIINNLRVTDDVALDCVKAAAGEVRVEIEALLSMGLANSPMAGTSIKVTSGNFVTARPLGVINGVDYRHTGEVRRVDADAIRAQLDNGAVTLVPPLGYSPTGETFNLSAADLAAAVAIALNADKLIFLTEHELKPGRGSSTGSIVPREADALIRRRRSLPEEIVQVLNNAAQSCRSGVKRVHILKRARDGILLAELFTRDGAGMLVTQEPYEQIRTATIDDVGGILELIAPLESAGVLVKRSRELLEQEITRFSVIERDGSVIGCAALYPFTREKLGELACLAIHDDYRNGGRGEQLLEHICEQASAAGLEQVFVLTTRTLHWFRERGFQSAAVETLPSRKRDLYNWQRNSKVMLRDLRQG